MCEGLSPSSVLVAPLTSVRHLPFYLPKSVSYSSLIIIF